MTHMVAPAVSESLEEPFDVWDLFPSSSPRSDDSISELLLPLDESDDEGQVAPKRRRVTKNWGPGFESVSYSESVTSQATPVLEPIQPSEMIEEASESESLVTESPELDPQDESIRDPEDVSLNPVKIEIESNRTETTEAEDSDGSATEIPIPDDRPCSRSWFLFEIAQEARAALRQASGPPRAARAAPLQLLRP